jgi:hypothetical protein
MSLEALLSAPFECRGFVTFLIVTFLSIIRELLALLEMMFIVVAMWGNLRSHECRQPMVNANVKGFDLVCLRIGH